ncbi:MAG: hypothetical protein GWQ05_21160 [Verrucomicrobiaceae bacterium]|jgi:heme/copper-type cytochrome/quinol oxidase subunit 2|nr:hypothetical protein [Verrucomicrobiaceae bacterium]
MKRNRFTILLLLPMVVAVVLWAVLPRHRRAAMSSGDDLVVEARGYGRAWQFSYGDARSDGRLVLPVGLNVELRLRSDDFIYVFSCPDLGLKEIAVPDLKFSVGFKAEQVGTHTLAMDPMCGFQLAPGQTMGTLEIVSQSKFRRWLLNASK